MKLKCRICGEEMIAPHQTDTLLGFTGNELRDHLQQHKWTILKLIQGTEGDGSFARFLESLLFEAILAPGEVAPIAELPMKSNSRLDWRRLQVDLLEQIRNEPAVDPDLKGAPRPQKRSGK